MPRRELRKYNPRLSTEEAPRPPYWWYTEQEIFDHERYEIFEKCWMAVGRADQVEKPGDYFTGEIVDNPYVVIRGEDDILRAFHNVCRHAAAQPAQDCGNLKECELVCPYHGWSYKLNGHLKSAPHMGKMKNFDPGRDGSLKPIAVDVWGPFVFIDLDGYWNCDDQDAPKGKNVRDLQTDLADIKPALEGLGLSNMRFVERRTYTMDCNWKVVVDNALDGGYHVAYAHEDLAAGLEFSGYETQLFSRSSMQISTTKGIDKRLGDKVIYAWLFPNFFVNRYGDMMDTNLILPLGVEKCMVIYDFYFGFDNMNDWHNKKVIKKSIETSEAVQNEDKLVCEMAQKGMRSMAFDHGRYSEKLEKGVHAFHRLLWEELDKRGV